MNKTKKLLRTDGLIVIYWNCAIIILREKKNVCVPSAGTCPLPPRPVRTQISASKCCNWMEKIHVPKFLWYINSWNQGSSACLVWINNFKQQGVFQHKGDIEQNALQLCFCVVSFQKTSKKCIRATNKENACLLSNKHSQGVCQGTTSHCYVMPYLQTADRMRLQIPPTGITDISIIILTHIPSDKLTSWQAVPEQSKDFYRVDSGDV